MTVEHEKYDPVLYPNRKELTFERFPKTVRKIKIRSKTQFYHIFFLKAEIARGFKISKTNFF